MHWVLDVTFREDDYRVRKGHAARNLSAKRKLTLSALHTDTLHSAISLRCNEKFTDHRPNCRPAILKIKRPQ